jgi:hypothetical protein
MPKRIVTIYVCSMCKDEFRDDAITSFAITRLPGPELLLDLCAQCMSTGSERTMLEFLDLAYSEGPKSKATASAAAGSCPECGKSYTSQQGLAQHRTRAHGVESESARRSATVGKVGDLRCPDCKDFRTTRPQGLAAHRRAVHGVTGSSPAVVAAKKQQPASKKRGGS